MTNKFNLSEKHHEILFSQSHASATNGVKANAADLSITSLEDIPQAYEILACLQSEEAPTCKVKVNNLKI